MNVRTTSREHIFGRMKASCTDTFKGGDVAPHMLILHIHILMHGLWLGSAFK